MKSLFSLEQCTKIFPRLKRKLSESSQFGKKLIESRKLRRVYGKPSQNYLQALYKKSYCPSQISLSFFRFLESRLDVVLYRAHFFESLATAKQQVRIGRIEVNNKKVVSPGYNVLPGDIIKVVSQCKEKRQLDKNAIVFKTNPKEHFLSSKKSRKKSGSRYQRSSFLVSLFASQFKKTITAAPLNADNKMTQFKTKAVGKSYLYRLSKLPFKEFSMANLLKIWCFQNTFLISLLSTLRKFSTKTKKGVKQNRLFEEGQENFANPILLQEFVSQNKIEGYRAIGNNKKKTFKSETDYFKNNFLSLLEKIKEDGSSKQSLDGFSLEKETLLRDPVNLTKLSLKDYFVKNNSLTSYQKAKIEEKSRFCYRGRTSFNEHSLESARLLNSEKKLTEISNWLFFNFALFLKKRAISTKKKLSCFFFQRNQPFFKSQFFFVAKKTKPLHLEISYRSRSIIFLYPPQRVCFSSFIDLSQIYK